MNGRIGDRHREDARPETGRPSALASADCERALLPAGGSGLGPNPPASAGTAASMKQRMKTASLRVIKALKAPW